MTYEILRLLHIIGLSLIAAGLIGVFVSDLRSRQLVELAPFAEAIRNIAVFYDGVVVPGALLLLASGTWLIGELHGGWDFLEVPLLLVIVSLGVIRPDTWTHAIVGIGVSLLVAAALTVLLPRLYPWSPDLPARDSED